MMSVSVQLLGPLTVTVGGHPIPSWRPKHRHLLALLAAQAGRSVSMDVLVDEVWRDDPPAAARANVRTYFAAIRAVLGPVHRIATTSNGYRWDLPSAATDISRITVLAEEARRCSPEDAPRVWDAASELIGSGRPFDDVPDGGYLESLRGALSVQFAAVCEERFAAYLAAGRSRSIIAELISYVRENLLREDAHAQLIRALYATGDAAGALTAYRAAHATLSAELGIEPGPTLRAALANVLDDEPCLICVPNMHRRRFAARPVFTR
jgi:SARP family transcriptional regulator, regulator of embCAB operon